MATLHHNPISIANLSYTYEDGTQALNSINFNVKPTEQVLGDPDFLHRHALEPPLCYSRPYCQIDHAPTPLHKVSFGTLSPQLAEVT